jgi:hypothetical protein
MWPAPIDAGFASHLRLALINSGFAGRHGSERRLSLPRSEPYL